MNRDIADFLQANQQLIEAGDFRKLYDNAIVEFKPPQSSYRSISELTEIFEEAGIDPLYYMNDIPYMYHFKSDLPKTYSIGNIDTIDAWAFAYTTGVETLDISSVRYIGEYAFYISSIKAIDIPGSVKEIQPHTFQNSDLVNAVINEGTTDILNEAFANCHNLTDIWLPKSLLDLSTSAFSDCNKLKNIYYNGTSYYFYATIVKDIDISSIGYYSVNVHCTDKVITVYG